jgi:excinuclease UvrABC nuclease subunit
MAKSEEKKFAPVDLERIIAHLKNNKNQVPVELLFAKRLQNKAESGVYSFFLDTRCVYIGESKDIGSRLLSHINGTSGVFQLYPWIREKSITLGFSYIQLEGKVYRLSVERYLIRYCKPILNIKENRGVL